VTNSSQGNVPNNISHKAIQRVTEWRTGFANAAVTAVYEMFYELDMDASEIAAYVSCALAPPRYTYIFKHVDVNNVGQRSLSLIFTDADLRNAPERSKML
jgi:hypothetical protein